MAQKISTTAYIDPEQNKKLHELKAATKVPVAEYIRQGIDLVLLKIAREHPELLLEKKDDGPADI